MRSAQNISHKPAWLKTRLSGSKTHSNLKTLVRDSKLNTVCEEAKCPNIHECWGERKTVTFMILGDVCTRACRFCAVTSGKPSTLDLNEPERVAKAVAQMQLSHAVITAVARDDLADGGATIFADTVRAIRKFRPSCTVEVLPSDMGGDYKSQHMVMQAKPDILNHNIETVRRLSDRVRSMAKYERSLEFLHRAKEMQPWTLTKSSIMIGLGETKNEILETMDDLRAQDVDILTIGQYIAPTQSHARYLSVQKYWHPDEFAELKAIALTKGFRHCESGPKVRSSYHADEQARLARSNFSV
jgi:lipoyl synthase